MNKILNRLPTDFFTLVELLRWRALQQPEQQAFTFLLDGEQEEQHWTYGELDCQARVIAALLQGCVAPGERALLLYPPGLEYIAAFFGCLYAGVIAVPAYPPHLNRPTPRLQAIVNNAQPTVVLTTTQILSNGLRLLSYAPELKALQWLVTDNLSGGLEKNWQETAVTSDTLAFLQYTSGSTAMPKGVMLTHSNLLHNLTLIHQGFEHSSNSQGVIWLPPYHDMGLIGGVLQPLYGGFPVTLMAPVAFLQRPFRWLQAISRYKATTSGGPNFAYDLCVRKITPEQRATLDLSSWEVAFNGAEPIRHETLEEFAEAFEACGFRREAFYPCYGLAEATLIVSGSKKAAPPVVQKFQASALAENRLVEVCAENEDTQKDIQTFIGNGQTPANQEIVIVNPESLTRCLPNQVGEIWVSGPSVAQGYWHRLEATEITFRAYLSDTGQGPFLRTGDLGFLHNGELFITGRLKDLIIIRGRNHYPQDIELTVERSHPALRLGCGAVFAVDAIAHAQERLVVVQEVERHYRNPDVDEIVASIRQAVSEHHELQVYAVLLVKTGSIPKTSSGKIQRHACRDRFLDGSLVVIGSSIHENTVLTGSQENLSREALLAIEPENRPQVLTSYLQEQVAEVLKVAPSELQPQKSLITLGVDSLMAVELNNEIESRLGVVLPMTYFLQGPSIAQLVTEVLTQLTAPAAIPKTTIAPVQSSSKHTLSYGQRALWFLHELAPESAAYNIVNAVRIREELDIPALQRAFQTLVDRHPVLRTSFSSSHGEPMQQVREHVDVCFQIEDASTWSEESLSDRIITEAHLPFNLEQAPLLRVNLFSRSAREHIFLLAVHHIIADFWSLAVLVHELGILYQAYKAGTSATLAPVNLQYTDYACWQAERLASSEGERLWGYWQQQLSGELPVLNLPTDRPRPPIQTYRGATVPFQLSAELTQKLKTLSCDRQATLYMTMLAAFQVLLYRYTGQEDILVGSPTTGRSASELKNILGYFVNQVVLRANISEKPSFDAFLAQVRQTVLDAFEHQDYPFGLLVERLQPVRDPSRSPLFQAMFVLQKAHLLNEEGLTAFALGHTGKRMHLGGLELESFALEQRIAQFDLTLMVAEVEGELAASFQYNTDLFDAVTIARMAEHFQTLLEGIVANPQQRLADLPLLTAAEQHLLREWNSTTTSYVQQQCLHQLFEQQVEKTPEAIALTYENEHLTYQQLNQRANQLAHQLQQLGVKPDVKVGICLERSLEMVIGILGILKAGGAYVPLDPQIPQERLTFILEDAQITVLLTQQQLLKNLPEHDATILCLDADWELIARQTSENPTSIVTAESLAYVIYTSGSTGKPKGVLINHSNAVRLFAATQSWYQFNEQDVWTLFHSFAFDFSVWEIWGALIYGGRLVIVPYCVSRSPEAFYNLLCCEQVTVLNQTPSAFRQLIRTEESLASPGNLALRWVIFGGEALELQSLKPWFDRHGDKCPTLVNMYGITETTVHVTIRAIATSDLSEGKGSVIGRPIPDLQVYVLDQKLQQLPIGVPGEMYVGGAGLARGYLNRPDLTAKAFIPHPFSDDPEARLYKTGDLARYLANGDLEYLGRIDHQVKIRGFRIELGEIESALAQHPGIRETVVLVRENARHEKCLVAYVVFQPEQAPTSLELRYFLKERLPEYMVPSVFIVLDTLPLTPNGKLDRRGLPLPDWTRSDRETTFVAPRSAIEAVIAGIWCEILGIEQVSIYDNFFDLGGHSLLATQVMSRLREIFRVELPLHNLFEATTVAKLSELLIAHETKPGKIEKIAQVVQQIEAMTVQDIKNTLHTNLSSKS